MEITIVKSYFDFIALSALNRFFVLHLIRRQTSLCSHEKYHFSAVIYVGVATKNMYHNLMVYMHVCCDTICHTALLWIIIMQYDKLLHGIII